MLSNTLASAQLVGDTFENIHEDDMKKMHLDTAGSRRGVATDNLPKLIKLFAKLESLNVASTALDKSSEPHFKTMM